MLFNSIAFLFFFPLVFVLYYSLPHRWRWLQLLFASVFFYCWWNPKFGWLLLYSTALDYFCGRALAATESPPRRRLLVALSIAGNLGVLIYFKYLGFFSSIADSLLHGGDETVRTIPIDPSLPIGISFYTFQTLGYTLDVYRRRIPAERHFGRFALYVTFFPQLVAGPIESARNLLPQLGRKVAFDYPRVVSGARLVAAGLFKKVVIADNLGVLVQAIYGDPTRHSGLPLILGTIGFTYQLFCDFSGYSDIAVGCARMLGIDLMRNFERPFFTRNLSEFWRRTHASLGLWFRENLYIPLGGSRRGRPTQYRNIFIVFVLSGLWHGASWNYLLWGASQGAFFVFGALTLPLRSALVRALGLDRRPRLLAGLQHLKVFALYSTSMVFFRASSLRAAYHVFTHAPVGLAGQLQDGETWWRTIDAGGKGPEILLAALFIVIMEVLHGIGDRHPTDRLVADRSTFVRWLIYVSMTLAFLLCGNFHGSQFIYFQF